MLDVQHIRPVRCAAVVSNIIPTITSADSVNPGRGIGKVAGTIRKPSTISTTIWVFPSLIPIVRVKNPQYVRLLLRMPRCRASSTGSHPSKNYYQKNQHPGDSSLA
jgi:hypothetical protein